MNSFLTPEGIDFFFKSLYSANPGGSSSLSPDGSGPQGPEGTFHSSATAKETLQLFHSE